MEYSGTDATEEALEDREDVTASAWWDVRGVAFICKGIRRASARLMWSWDRDANCRLGC